MEPAIYTLIGVLVGGFITFAYHWVDNYYNNKVNRRKLIIEAAINYWNKNNELVLKAAKGSKKTVEFMPLSAYIIFFTKLLPLYEKKNLNDEKITKILNSALKAEDIVESQYDKSFK